MPSAETGIQSGSATVNENGRILIPAPVRSQMGIKAGDSVVWTLENGVLHVESYRASIRKLQEEMQRYKKPAEPVVDEFIAERREEARREREEGIG
jgi:AbrB family looped-hinge helix DNA binding protein